VRHGKGDTDGIAAFLQLPRAESDRLLSHRVRPILEQTNFFRDGRFMKGYFRALRTNH
jgi:hypothetical protein